MRTIKAETFNTLMGAVRAEMKKGRIFEAALVSEEGECLDGMVEKATGDIYIDPGPQLVELFIHEALHRAFPRWGERRICKTAHLLVMAMSDAERRSWYRAYRKTAKKMTKPVMVDA